MKELHRVKHFFDGQEYYSNYEMLLEDGIIQSLGKIGSLNIDDNIKIIDHGDKFMMPGIIDTHIHFFSDPEVPTFGDYFAKHSTTKKVSMAINNATLALRLGITSARDVASPSTMGIELRDCIKEGLVKGPDLYVSGRAICVTKGHGWQMGIESDGVEEVRKTVRTLIADNVDLIKVMMTCGLSASGPEMDPPAYNFDEIQTIVQEANKRSLKVAVHAQGVTAIKYSIDAGVSSIEHGVLLTEPLMEQMISKGVYYVPTFSAPHYGVEEGLKKDPHRPSHKRTQSIIKNHNEAFKKAHEKGVKIAMGSDTGTPYNRFETILQEIIFMAERGMSNKEALISSTKNAADLIGILQTTGTLETMKFADFLIIEGNPLESIDDINNTKSVYKKGILQF